ncbi:hypothetical protein AB0B28_05580 [Glycomyces sp. NPDC046736]|uniref:hypothetical protein n=1 Tax=Glycomyces sp. NPDC046736 TaxID=3155615 RepID=UPI00340F47BF
MVKQAYETVQVQLGRNETSELHIRYARDRTNGEDRLYVGSRPYVERALASANSGIVMGVGCGVGLGFLALAVIRGVVGAAGSSLGLSPSQAVLTALGGATLVGLIGGFAIGLKSRRAGKDPGELAPEPIRMSGGALILPAAAQPPNRPGILLRVRPRPRTMNMIGFPRRPLRDTRKRIAYEFYYNELIDWVTPPRVHLDGHDLGAAWGTWWIPATTGPHRLRVEIDGIGDHDTGIAEETEVRVDAEPRHLTAHFNFIALAHRREQARPDQTSRWQQVMRKADRYTDMADQALSEPDLEFTTPHR